MLKYYITLIGWIMKNMQIYRARAFVIMPFDQKFDNFYQLVVKGACEKAGVECIRVDENKGMQDHVVEVIYRNIRNADIVIADLTGAKPNVYYELGFAKAHGKKIIPLTQSYDDLRFDFRSYNVHKYSESSMHNFVHDLAAIIEDTLNLPTQGIDILGVYEKSADLQTIMGDFIKTVNKSIVFSGAHFAVSASDRRKELLKKLKEGVSITYHIIDPDSDAVEATAKLYSMRSPELKSECNTGVVVLKGLIAEAEQANASGKVTVLFAGEQPQARYMLFDHSENRGKVVVTPYVDNLRSSHSPSYVFRAKSNVALAYIDCCVRAMERGKEVDVCDIC